MTGLHLIIALLTLVLGLVGALLIREYVNRGAMARWLADSRTGELPDGAGPWRAIFAAQERILKAHKREVAEVAFRLERYYTAAQVLPDGIVLLDAEKRIEWLNAAAADHLGIEPVRDVRTLISQLVRKPAFNEYLDGFRRDGGDLSADGIQLQVGDDGRTLALQLLPFSAEGALLVTRDITSIVRTEKMRSDFVANVSHELRTPATVITGFLEQLTGDDPPVGEDAQRFLRLMADQARRMNRLVEDLLTLSRLESDSRPQREEVVDVPALVVTLAAEGRALSGGRHVIEVGEIADCKVRGSVDELRSAMGNLVSNAIRYTPEGGHIRISWSAREKDACLAVTDTGIGIAPEHIPRLTERFYRVDRGRSTATGGTGLGLAIVKHALARHQGRLNIQSVLGRGSTFSACLPTERVVSATARSSGA